MKSYAARLCDDLEDETSLSSSHQGVRSGVLFFDTSGKGYISPAGIFSPQLSVKGFSADFIRQWSASAGPDRRAVLDRYSPTQVIGGLVQDQGLVIVAKTTLKESLLEQEDEDEPGLGPPPAEPTVHIPSQEPFRPVRYRVEDVDGILDYNEVLSMIHHGKIIATTQVKRVGEHFNWKRAQSFTEFQSALEQGPQASVSGLATKAPSLDPPVVAIYKYVSAEKSPSFSPGQLDAIKTTFGASASDRFFWYPSLDLEKASEVAGTMLFKGEASI
jgi:hypothetical protein